MKVQADYRIVFKATREVDIPEQQFEEWARDRYQPGFDRELAIAAWIDNEGDELSSEVFSDWRSDKPLPSDFELQYTEVEDVELPTPSGSGS